MSDEDYSSFLDKANQDTGASKSSSSKKDTKFASTKAVDTGIPSPLQNLDAYYISDSDEPFEAVALKHNGKDLSTSNFGKLIGHSGDVEASDVKRFNSSGKYGDVIDKVSKCGDGVHVPKVFRVGHGGTRAEYWVVIIDGEGNVVGVKARAVES